LESELAVCIKRQVLGVVLGVWLAHVMFERPALQVSAHVRTGGGQWVAEAIATFGLLNLIWGCRTDVQLGPISPALTGSRPRPHSPTRR
jgi:hypothetical protein